MEGDCGFRLLISIQPKLWYGWLQIQSILKSLIKSGSTPFTNPKIEGEINA